MDKIFLTALTTETVIGIFDWEREVKQAISIDLEMSADIRRAARSDTIEDTLNYKAVAKRVLAFVRERGVTHPRPFLVQPQERP